MVGMMRKRRGWAARVRGWDALAFLIHGAPILRVQRCRQLSIEQLYVARTEVERGRELLTITKDCGWR